MYSFFKKTLITLLVGGILFFVLASILGIFGADNARDALAILTDSAFVVGVIIAGIGVLIVISNDGTYDAFGYAVKRVWGSIFGRRQEKQSYHEYKQAKDDNRAASPWHMVVVGIFFVLVAVVFLIVR